MLNKSDCLIVPSQFTRQDIKEAIHCNCKMEVIHLGWQHYLQIQEDDEIFNLFSTIKKQNYYYTISSISPHKNLKFIYELAKKNPDAFFVITGGMNRGYGFDFTVVYIGSRVVHFAHRFDDIIVHSFLQTEHGRDIFYQIVAFMHFNPTF